MAELKFNFYNTYNEYYRNINKINKYNLFTEPNYELIITKIFFLEVFPLLYKNILPLYVLYEHSIRNKIKYNVCKSLKKINRQKIYVKKVFKYRNYNWKIFNLFKL